MSNAYVGDRAGSKGVEGPASATDNAVTRFDGTTGKLIQNSGVILSDTDALTGIASVTLDIGATIDEFSIDGTLSGNSDTAAPTEKAVKTYVDDQVAPHIFGGLAASFQVNTTTAIAPVYYRDFGSLELLCRSYSNAETQYSQGEFRCPDDVDASGTVTFEITGSARTAAASKNVKFTFDVIEAGSGDVLTGAYGSAQAWDDQAISGTQDSQDIISNTATVAALGLEGGKRYYWRLYRSAATTNDLAALYDVISFYGIIPRV